MKIKPKNKYYLSVEGETEQWYFEHLGKIINKTEDSKYKVELVIKPKKSPISMTKTLALSNAKDTIAFHICDYESNDDCHVKMFIKTLDELKEIRTIRGSATKYLKEYILGYSNFSFDLWIALHKKQCLSPIQHRKNYINNINCAYNTKHQFIEDYKKEDNFKAILANIEIPDVIFALKNAEEIRRNNNENQKQFEYKGFKYYKNNPDLTIDEVVRRILIDCKINIPN